MLLAACGLAFAWRLANAKPQAVEAAPTLPVGQAVRIIRKSRF
jgi:hypothetical protein